MLIRQRGATARDGNRADSLLVLLDADRAGNPRVPGSWLDDRMRPKLLAIKVNGCHPIPVIREPAAAAARQGVAATASVM